MKKEELLRHVGSMQQVAYARRLTFGEGRSRGMEAVEADHQLSLQAGPQWAQPL